MPYTDTAADVAHETALWSDREVQAMRAKPGEAVFLASLSALVDAAGGPFTARYLADLHDCVPGYEAYTRHGCVYGTWLGPDVEAEQLAARQAWAAALVARRPPLGR